MPRFLQECSDDDTKDLASARFNVDVDREVDFEDDCVWGEIFRR